MQPIKETHSSIGGRRFPLPNEESTMQTSESTNQTSDSTMPTNDPFSQIFRSLRQLVEQGPAEWDISGNRSRFRLQVANSPDLRERCFRLGHEVYRKMGFIEKSDSKGLLISKYDVLPETFSLLVSDQDGRDVATITLVFDSEENGLPLDEIYKEEVDGLRRKNRRAAEFVRLAVDDSIRGSREILVHLFNFCYIYARQVMQYDDFLITVNPHHANYYRKLLGFDVLGKEKPCPKVKGAPAILLCLPLSIPEERVRQNGGRLKKTTGDRSLYPFFFAKEAEPFIAAFLKYRHSPMNMEEARILGLIGSEETEAEFLGR